MAALRQLQHVWPGMPIVVGGDRVVELPAEIAQRFAAGDALAVVPETGDILHIPARERALVRAALERARSAFSALGGCSDAQLCRFFEEFAAALETPSVWEEVAPRNAEDVDDARARGRSTTRSPPTTIGIPVQTCCSCRSVAMSTRSSTIVSREAGAPYQACV